MTGNELLKRFQNGDKSAGEELLKKYEGFIAIFASLLYYGNYNHENTGVKKFLSLLCSENNEKLDNIIKVINEMYSSYDYEDVLQDVQLSFLFTAKIYNEKYTSENVENPFDYFLSFYFPYILKKNTIDKLNNEPLTSFYTGFHRAGSELATTTEEAVFDEEINDNWVSGDTCNEEFFLLTEEERRLLKLRYVDEMTLQEIADLEKKAKSTISRKIKRVKKKILKNRKQMEQ